MAVVKLDDYRLPSDKKGPCTVTVFAVPFNDENGSQTNLKVSIAIEDGDFQGIIDAIVEMGGIYMPPQADGRAWFLPWPPAAISISPERR
ncbi:MAG: hypothetical protein ACHQRJ_12915 [Alphaproteobacteria bacterium]